MKTLAFTDNKTLIKGIVDSIFTTNKFPKVPFKEIYVRAGEGGTPATSISEYALRTAKEGEDLTCCLPCHMIF